MDLDLRISQAAMRIRTMERALHDAGPWAMVTEGGSFAARREIGEDQIIFTTNALVRPNESVDLYCDDVLISSRRFDEVTHKNVWNLQWVFSLSEIRI